MTLFWDLINISPPSSWLPRSFPLLCVVFLPLTWARVRGGWHSHAQGSGGVVRRVPGAWWLASKERAGHPMDKPSVHCPGPGSTHSGPPGSVSSRLLSYLAFRKQAFSQIQSLAVKWDLGRRGPAQFKYHHYHMRLGLISRDSLSLINSVLRYPRGTLYLKLPSPIIRFSLCNWTARSLRLLLLGTALYIPPRILQSGWDMVNDDS